MAYLCPLPVALPLFTAALVMALRGLGGRRLTDVLSIAASAAVTAICAALLAHSLDSRLVYWFGGWKPHNGIALGIAFAVDPLGAGLALLTAVLTLASLVFSWRYFDEVEGPYPALMLTFLGAMAGFCLTGDLFNLFVFFELMSVSAYALTGLKIEEEHAVMGAFNFAITNSIGAFLVLTGIALLYGRTGALNLAQLGQTLAGHPADGLVVVALLLVTCGFGIKAALAPFHFWLADAHAVAPSPVCVLFSGVMVELGLYAIIRLYWMIFAGADHHVTVLRATWVALGAITAMVGAVMCFAQRHLKRMLAFSTISHTGIFLVGAALLTPDGLAGTSLYVVGHGLVKGALFLGAGILLNRFASVDENELRGKGRILPGVGVLFLIGGLALSGLPPFGTYLGKSLIEEASGRLGYGWVPVLLLIASAVTGAAVLRAASQVFLGIGPPQGEQAHTPTHEEREKAEDYQRAPLLMFAPPALMLTVALLVGLWPGLARGTQRASAQFQNRQAYAAAVLNEEEAVPEVAVTPSGSPLPGILYGIGAAVGAAILAAVALFPHFVPKTVRHCGAFFGSPFMKFLQAQQSGDVVDYVAWIVLGVSLLGCLFALLLP